MKRLIALLLTVMLLSSCALNGGTASATKLPALPVRYYYESECGSCKEDIHFLQRWDQAWGDEKDRDVLSAPDCINLFTSDGASFAADCKRLGVTADKAVLPFLVLGDLYLEGDSQILSYLSLYRSIAVGSGGDSRLWYIYRPDCGDCVRLAPWLSKAEADHPEVQLIRLDVTPIPEKEAFKRLLRHLEIGEERWQIPFVFYRNEAYSGNDEIEALSFIQDL